MNGVNTTHSTHDEVVNIVRKSGGTLAMKVITPLVKPKSVSQQIKNQFTPVSTPDTEKKDKESPKPPQFQKYNSATILNSTFQPILGDNAEMSDRETVIDSGHSPVLPRSGNMEWDSQGEDSPTPPRRAANLSGYSPVSTSVKGRSASNFREEVGRQGSSTLRMGRSPKSASAIHTKPDLTRTKTLPPSSKYNPPKLSDYADSDDSVESEEDTTSSFANALRKSRAKITRKSSLPRVQQRERSNTMPSPASTPPQRSSPLLVKRSVDKGPEDKMSPLQMELLKASQERSNRVSMQQSRLTHVQSKEGDSNSLADVLSRRLDSMNSKIKSPEDSDDSFEDSPRLLPGNKSSSAQANTTSDAHVHEPMSRATPPSVKPKPTRKERQERQDSPLVEVKISSNVSQGEKTTGLSGSPWEVKLRSAPKKGQEPKTPPVVGDRADRKQAGNNSAPPKGGSTNPMTREQDTPAFILPPPLPDSNQRLSYGDAVAPPPPAFTLEMEETSTDEILSPHPIELRSHKPLSKGQRAASPIPPPLPQSSPPPKIPSATSVFVFPEASGRSREGTTSPESLPLSLPTPEVSDLPSPLPSPTRERSGFSASPLPPPAFGGSDEFASLETHQEKTSTFTPISVEAEAPPIPGESPPPPPSESPPPLPSTEPPLLDSDVSLVAGDIHSDSASSPGSSPQSYSVTTMELSPTSEQPAPKVAPLVSKKPKRGFYIPSPEREGAPQEVVAPVKKVTSEIFPVNITSVIAPESSLAHEVVPEKLTKIDPPVPEMFTPAKEVSKCTLQWQQSLVLKFNVKVLL